MLTSSAPSPLMPLPDPVRASLLNQAEQRGLYVERYEMRGAAAELQASAFPEVLVAGPAGTGKSIGCLVKLHRWASTERIRALIVRKTRVSLTESGLASWENKVLGPRHPLVVNGPRRRFRESYIYPNGSEIVIGGLDNPTRIMSTEYDMIYVQEATELDVTDWESLTTRFRGGHAFTQLVADCNPDSDTHWLYQRCMSGATLLLTSIHEDNPYLYDGHTWTPAGIAYIARLENLTGVRKERLRYGRWVGAEGMVYGDWSRRLHIIGREQLPPMHHYIASQDWGFTNPGVLQIWGVDGDGRMYLVREHYRVQQSIGWWKATATREWQTCHFDSVECDPSEPGFIAEYQKTERDAVGRLMPGLPAIPAFNGIHLGIQAVQRRLSVAGDDKPRLFVVEDALAEADPLLPKGKPRWNVEERPRYVWALGVDGKPTREEPLDDNNHSMDAERYAVAAVDGLRGDYGEVDSDVAAALLDFVG